MILDSVKNLSRALVSKGQHDKAITVTCNEQHSVTPNNKLVHHRTEALESQSSLRLVVWLQSLKLFNVRAMDNIK